MSEWSASYISSLPDSAFACIDSAGRHYPHHDASGALDLAHLRNALSRLNQAGTATCGKGHLEAHARAAGIGKSEQPVKATLLDDDAFRLLAFPFGGPLPSPHFPRGVDFDFETFTERTDLKADWLKYRPVDFHHGNDEKLGRSTFAKAILDPAPEDDGRWVTVWADRQSRYMADVKKLIESQVELYGSSESVKGMTRKADTGEILVWPYWRQTLSPLPRNTYSVLRPIKAALEDALEQSTGPSFWADFATELRYLGADLSPTSGQGEETAKSGRVLSALNETDIEQALEALLGSAEKVRQVLARARKESTA